MARYLGTAVLTAGLPRPSTVLALVVALFAVECTSGDERPLTGGGAGTTNVDGGAGAGAGGDSSDHEGEAGAGAGGASGGSADHEGEAGAGAGAGGVAGRDDSPSEGGSPDDHAGGEAGSPSDLPPDPGPLEPKPLQTGLPCEVEAMLRARCQSCHSSHPVAGGGVSLLMYADLIAESKVDSSDSVAARVLKRIKDTEFPMPPSPVSPPTDEEIAALEEWVNASTPVTYCNAPNEPNEPDPDLDACTSKAFWKSGTAGSPWMMPGRACIACHKTTNGPPRFAVAGTMYPTAHEPDTCYGVPASTGAVVIITDANGVEQPPLPVASGGNFFARWTTLAVPYRAKVVVGDRESVMLTPQTNGDCNACHTRDGAEGALGRITLPETVSP